MHNTLSYAAMQIADTERQTNRNAFSIEWAMSTGLNNTVFRVFAEHIFWSFTF